MVYSSVVVRFEVSEVLLATATAFRSPEVVECVYFVTCKCLARLFGDSLPRAAVAGCDEEYSVTGYFKALVSSCSRLM